MRRTDEEFKAEVFRRSEAFRSRRTKRRKMIAAICLPVVLFGSAWMVMITGASGGATEGIGIAADSAYAEEAPQEPAAAAPESAEEYAPAAECPIEMPAEGTEFSAASTSEPAVQSVTVTSQPEMEEYAREFLDPEHMGLILDAVQAFFDDPDTQIVTDDGHGNAEGMGYRIVIAGQTQTLKYYLFHDALLADGVWYVNRDCFEKLERLITMED